MPCSARAASTAWATWSAAPHADRGCACIRPDRAGDASPARQLLALLDGSPRLWRHVAVLMTRRLTLAMSVIRDFSVAPLDQRIVRRLLGQAMSGGADIAGSAPIEMRVNQSDLSRMLGSSRSRVNVELKRMESARLLEIGYRSITLVDLARLREIAGPEVFSF